MGGLGSGRRSSRGYFRVTENAQPLDIRRLKRAGVLVGRRPFGWVWTVGGNTVAEICGHASGNTVLISDADPKGDPLLKPRAQQWLQVIWTQCNYGGTRQWWQCPGCGRRVAVLYRRGQWFACRHCHALIYASQLEGVRDRALRRAQQIRKKMGGSANMALPFPWKPKWMRWRTYDRLRTKADIAFVQYAEQLRKSLRFRP